MDKKFTQEEKDYLKKYIEKYHPKMISDVDEIKRIEVVDLIRDMRIFGAVDLEANKSELLRIVLNEVRNREENCDIVL